MNRPSKKSPKNPKNKRGPGRGSIKSERTSRSIQNQDHFRLRKVVGIHSCSEVLSVRPESVKEIWLQQGWERSQQLHTFENFARKRNVKLKEVSPKTLSDLSWGHQGIATLTDSTPKFSWQDLEKPGRQTVVLLDGIEDPQNLGAMLRTCWLMEVSAIFTPQDRAVGLTPSVCKVASGGAEHIPLEASNNFTTIISKLKELNFWTYALAEHQSENIYTLDLPEKVAWIIGSEDKGVRKSTLKAADAAVAIPQTQTGSSYNATVALAIALSETHRQSF